MVFGGLLVLQSSDVLDLPKIAYLAVAVAATVGSIYAVIKTGRSGALPNKNLLLASALLLFFLFASLPIALAHGTPLAPWLRDAATYGLFGLAAVFAVDLGYSGSRRLILTLFIIAGLLSTIGFTLEWMDRRNIMSLSLAWIPLPSGGLASALFVTASAFAFRSDRPIPWAILAGLLLASFLLVGTRSRIPFIAVPIVLALISHGTRWRNFLLPLAAIGLATALFFGVGTAALSVASSPGDDHVTGPPPVDVGELGERIGSVGTLVRHPARDPSFQERIAQTRAAWHVFVVSPITGTGPGYEIEWTTFSGQRKSGYYLDTPVMELAKFGLVGLALGIVWVVAFARFIGDGLRRARASPEVLALIGYAIILVYSVPLSPPTHDKGTAFSLIFLIALGLQLTRSHDPPAPVSA
jgi:O-antigen ligase/polysaccharide polymerase Wzy-like membrane protein